jgi:hypothetical protein
MKRKIGDEAFSCRTMAKGQCFILFESALISRIYDTGSCEYTNRSRLHIIESHVGVRDGGVIEEQSDWIG